jgi:hypothetical protein
LRFADGLRNQAMALTTRSGWVRISGRIAAIPRQSASVNSSTLQPLALQRQLFETALDLISERNLVNTVIEVGFSDEEIECRQYPL